MVFLFLIIGVIVIGFKKFKLGLFIRGLVMWNLMVFLGIGRLMVKLKLIEVCRKLMDRFLGLFNEVV